MRTTLGLDPAWVDLLVAQRWPGNVRQLENFVERIVVLSDGPRIGAADVERELPREASRERASATLPGGGERSVAGLAEQRQQTEREAILQALSRARNNRSLAARILGVSRRTLYNRLTELGVE